MFLFSDAEIGVPMSYNISVSIVYFQYNPTFFIVCKQSLFWSRCVVVNVDRDSCDRQIVWVVYIDNVPGCIAN